MEEKNKKEIKPGLFTLARPHLMLAGSMIIMLVTFYTILHLLLPGFRSESPDYDLTELTEYLADETFIQGLGDDDFSTGMDIESGLSEISEEEIIEYLSFEHLSFEAYLINK